LFQIVLTGEDLAYFLKFFFVLVDVKELLSIGDAVLADLWQGFSGLRCWCWQLQVLATGEMLFLPLSVLSISIGFYVYVAVYYGLLLLLFVVVLDVGL